MKISMAHPRISRLFQSLALTSSIVSFITACQIDRTLGADKGKLGVFGDPADGEALAILRVRPLSSEELVALSARGRFRILHRFEHQQIVWAVFERSHYLLAARSLPEIIDVVEDPVAQAALPTSSGPGMTLEFDVTEIGHARLQLHGNDHWMWPLEDVTYGHGFRKYHSPSSYPGGDELIAIVDSGTDCAHPDFKPVFSSFIGSLCFAQRGDFVPGAPESSTLHQYDNFGTGTVFASTILARPNGFQALGAAPDQVLASYRVVDSTGTFSCGSIGAALDYIVTNGPWSAAILIGQNMPDTPAFRTACQVVQDAIRLLINQKRSSIIVPAGHTTTAAPPGIGLFSSYDTVLAVTSLDLVCPSSSPCRATQAPNQPLSEHVDIGAAFWAHAVTPNHPFALSGQLAPCSGSGFGCSHDLTSKSIAAAYATAAIAMMMERWPALYRGKPGVIIADLRRYARPLCIEPTDPLKYGSGILDIRRVINRDISAPDCGFPPPPPNSGPLAASLVGPSEIRLNVSCSYFASVSGGQPPYWYRWYINWDTPDNIVGEGNNYNTAPYSSQTTFTLIVRVGDSAGYIVDSTLPIAAYSKAPECNS